MICKLNLLFQEIMHAWIWFLRKIFLVFGGIILGFCAARYKDFDRINYNILRELQLQILALREESKESKISNVSIGDPVFDARVNIAEKHLEWVKVFF